MTVIGREGYKEVLIRIVCSIILGGWWLIHGKTSFVGRKISPKLLPQTHASVIGRQGGPQKDVRGTEMIKPIILPKSRVHFSFEITVS